MTTTRKATAKLPKGWQKGAPPHAGFWRTRDYFCDEGEWRYWNGKSWSIFVMPHEKSAPVKVLQMPFVYLGSEGVIQWRYDWPENARVARINPETGECTGTGPCPYEVAGMPWPFAGK